MSAEDLFITQLRRIDAVAVHVCRRNRVGPSDMEEFAAHVRLKLIEGDYAIIRKFKGESTFGTYITTVIARLFFQYRVQMWGKWRPSAEAKRLGQKGVLLEQLLTRDGYSFDEACQILTTGRST